MNPNAKFVLMLITAVALADASTLLSNEPSAREGATHSLSIVNVLSPNDHTQTLYRPFVVETVELVGDSVRFVPIVDQREIVVAKNQVHSIKKNIGLGQAARISGVPTVLAWFLDATQDHDAGAIRVAILRPDNVTDEDAAATERFYSSLIRELLKRNVTVVEREKLDAVLSELKLQQANEFSAADRLALGEQLGATRIIVGKFQDSEVPNQADIHLRLIDIGTGEVHAAVTQRIVRQSTAGHSENDNTSEAESSERTGSPADRTRAVGSEHPLSGLPARTEKPAALEMTTLGEFKKLERGAKLWANGSYIWLKIPESLEGSYFLQNADKHQGRIAFTVTRTGYVLLALPNSGNQNFEKVRKLGWEPLDFTEDFVDSCNTGGWTLFGKDCEKGEEVHLAVHNYHAPIVLVTKR